jgi:hypothetical protein
VTVRRPDLLRTLPLEHGTPRVDEAESVAYSLPDIKPGEGAVVSTGRRNSWTILGCCGACLKGYLSARSVVSRSALKRFCGVS